MNRRFIIVGIGILLLLVGSGILIRIVFFGSEEESTSAIATTDQENILGSTQDRPNILIIITDDQRYDTMDYMPITQERIFEKGIEFTSAYVTTSLCCPSRSSILTGLYAHNHGVTDNTKKLTRETFVPDIHEAGYYTGYIGKYLNTYSGEKRSEFDFWVAFRRSKMAYTDPMLNVNGEWINHSGYATYILRDYALEMLEEAEKTDKPFLLFFAPEAPHGPATPAPADKNLYNDLEPYTSPSMNEEDMSDKPEWMQEKRALSEEELGARQDFRKKQLRSLNAVDQSIGDILDWLESNGELQDTAIFFISDNGHFWGEHRQIGKSLVYEEATHVPLAFYYAPLIQKPRNENALVANIDIAPTVYQLADLATNKSMNGVSLIPLVTGDANVWRDALMIEGWAGEKVSNTSYAAVHTKRYVYVETKGDRSELYDLEEDPYQLENQIDNPEYAAITEELKKMLEELRSS